MPKVYVIDQMYAADWKVYFVDNLHDADERVMLVDHETEAEKTVYVVDQPHQADKKVISVHHAWQLADGSSFNETNDEQRERLAQNARFRGDKVLVEQPGEEEGGPALPESDKAKKGRKLSLAAMSGLAVVLVIVLVVGWFLLADNNPILPLIYTVM